MSDTELKKKRANKQNERVKRSRAKPGGKEKHSKSANAAKKRKRDNPGKSIFKTSSNFTLFLGNQIDDEPAKETEPRMFEQFRQLIEGTRTWEQLTSQLARNHNKFKKLKSFQVERFYELGRRLINRVDNVIGTENFYDNVFGIWNISIWLCPLIRLAKIREPLNVNHCVVAEGKTVDGDDEDVTIDKQKRILQKFQYKW